VRLIFDVVRMALLLGALGACKGHAVEDGRGDSGESPVDAGGDAHAARMAVLIDAAPPPDDAILPPPSQDLSLRARHLLEAIAEDNDALASDILFPRDGWLMTRDATDPGKDWEAHVAMPFRRSVHALSRRHHDLDATQVVSLELGGAVVQATPRRHGWKKPMWTVSGSRLTFVIGGHTRTLSIREMAAWRGAWYVTRLR
jgi:hypothetical protein